jgi:hypothetical protein
MEIKFVIQYWDDAVCSQRYQLFNNEIDAVDELEFLAGCDIDATMMIARREDDRYDWVFQS